MSFNIYEIFNSHIIFDKKEILEKINDLKKDLRKKEEEHASYHNNKYSIHYSENTFSKLQNRAFQIDIIYNNGKDISYINSEKAHETFSLRYFDSNPRMANCNLKIQKSESSGLTHNHFDFFSENDLSFKLSFNKSGLLIYHNEAEPSTYEINQNSYDNIYDILTSFINFDLYKTSDSIDLYNINTDISLSKLNDILIYITQHNKDFVIKNSKEKSYSPLDLIKKLMGKK